MIDRDKLNGIPPRVVAQTAMGVITELQNFKPHVQVAALGAAFLEVCLVHRTRPGDVLAVVNRVLNDDIHGQHPEFRALRAYAEGELADAK